MSANTAIEWAHHTFNPWWGCEKISPACAHCYADAFAHRLGMDIWGAGTPRRFFGDKHWAEPRKWNRLAGERSVRERVFCASMADVLEDREDLVPHRARLCELILATPNLIWMLLTKRPENAERLLPASWFAGEWPSNCWFGITVENQAMAARVATALNVPALIHFVSCEPLLGSLVLTAPIPTVWKCRKCQFVLYRRFMNARTGDVGGDATLLRERCPNGCGVWMQQMTNLNCIDLVIAGGESGLKARPSHPDWFRRLRDDCQAAGVAFFMKQITEKGRKLPMDQWPEDLRIREMPDAPR